MAPILAPHLPPLGFCSFGFPVLCGVEGGTPPARLRDERGSSARPKDQGRRAERCEDEAFRWCSRDSHTGGAPGLRHGAVQGITRPRVLVPGRCQEQVQTARCRAQPGRRLQTPQYWVLSQGSDTSPGGGGAHRRGTQTPGPARDTRASWVPGQGGQRRGTNDLLLNKVAFGE